MDIAVVLLICTSVALAWLLIAGLVALVAGRVIHERDVHDRPASRGTRIVRPSFARR